MADDYEANRMVQLAQLEQLGYVSDTVANGEEVLRALSVRDYDVIFLDIGMPVMDGIETARRIRERRQSPRPFLVAVTAGTAARDRARIETAGFDAYIAKPAGVADFVAVLDRAHAKLYGTDADESPASADYPGPAPDADSREARPDPVAEILLRRVVPVYLRELPSRTNALRAAFTARDPECLARLCHALKGAGRILGATALAAACEHMEQRAYAGQLPDADALEDLIDLATLTGRELRRKLAAPAA